MDVGLAQYDEEKIGPERIRHYIIELGWRATNTAFKNLGIPVENDDEHDDSGSDAFPSNSAQMTRQMRSSVASTTAGAEVVVEGGSDDDSDEYTDMVNPETGDPNLYLGLYAHADKTNSDDSDE